MGLQSSSATSALVVGFVSANVMTLPQALAVMLGSAVGASLTAQLIAFRITEFALGILFCGAVLYLFARRLRRRHLGQVILGLGLIFYGMYLMSSSMAPVKNYPFLVRALADLERYPLLEYFAAFLLTAILQSSPAFLALLMGLAVHGMVGPYAVVPFVLGAHLGGTVTGLLSSLGAPGRAAKRAAVANFLFKLGCGVLFLPFFRPLTRIMVWSSPDPSREIANAHTFFSLAMALVFLPWTEKVARFVTRLIPEGKARPGEARYLDESLLAVPPRAVEQAHRQTVEMARLVREEMLERVLPALRFGNIEILQEILEYERAVDSLAKQIGLYVTKAMKDDLPGDLAIRGLQVLYATCHLEHAGDTIVVITQIIRKLRAEELSFSEEGLEEIEVLYGQVRENFLLSLRALENFEATLATTVIKEHPRLLRLEKELRYNHFQRMQAGNEKTAATSGIHLDLIEAFLRLEGHAVGIAQVVRGMF